MRSLELWGGVECTVNRVDGRFLDQMRWSGRAGRPDDLDQTHRMYRARGGLMRPLEAAVGAYVAEITLARSRFAATI